MRAPAQPPVRPVPAQQGIPVNLPNPQGHPIDDAFWFELSRSWVSGAELGIAKQASAIQEAVKWFFGLSATATVIGLFFKDNSHAELHLTKLVFALGCLFIAYASATLAVTLSYKSIKAPNSPNSIRRAFNQSIIYSRISLALASLALVAGMGMISPALYTVYRSNKGGQTLPISLRASYDLLVPKTKKEDTIIKNIHISAQLPDSIKSLHFRIDSGASLDSSTTIAHFDHPSAVHAKNLDLVYPLNPYLKKPKGQLYLILIYQTTKDNLATKAVKIMP